MGLPANRFHLLLVDIHTTWLGGGGVIQNRNGGMYTVKCSSIILIFHFMPMHVDGRDVKSVISPVRYTQPTTTPQQSISPTPATHPKLQLPVTATATSISTLQRQQHRHDVPDGAADSYASTSDGRSSEKDTSIGHTKYTAHGSRSFSDEDMADSDSDHENGGTSNRRKYSDSDGSNMSSIDWRYFQSDEESDDEASDRSSNAASVAGSYGESGEHVSYNSMSDMDKDSEGDECSGGVGAKMGGWSNDGSAVASVTSTHNVSDDGSDEEIKWYS